jgi:predicted permease
VKRFLALLVRLFPASFRQQFGADMIEQIWTDHDRALSAGRLRAFGLAVATALDLVRSAVAEWLDPTWVGSGRTAKGDGMAGMASAWVRDLRLAARSLRRSPGFAAVVVGTLGLAIGANAGIFSVVDAVLLNPLPFTDPDRLVFIAASAPGSDFPEEFGVSSEFYLQYGEQSKLLEAVATYNAFTATLRAGDRAERVWMSWPTSTLFTTLGVTPMLGRLPVEEDDINVAVISHALWQSWFGGDSTVLGKTYEMAGAGRTVVGIMEPDFHFPDDRPLLWISNVIREEGLVPGRFGAPMVGRLAPGATHEALVNELTMLAGRLPERFGGPANYARLMEQHRPIVRRLDEQLLGPVARPLWVLLGAVGIVLLIACANVANLFLVRAEGRQRDLAVRRAIGAGRSQLIRSQLAESIVVAGLAGCLAVLLAWATVPVFLRSAPAEIPRLGDVGITVATLAFTLFAAVLAALACGLVPAVRGSAPDLKRLRESGRGSTRRRHWGRDGLVVAQTAMALVLLIGSGLLVRSFDALRNVDPGYDTEDIFTFQIAPEGDYLPDAPAYARFHMEFMDRLAALPGVESVGIVENVPLNEGTAGTRFRPEELANDPEAGSLLNFTFAAGDYFRTMGIAVRQGRGFRPSDHSSEPGNVVISSAAADLLWPGQDPIGRRLQRQGLDSWETVVGVVEDVVQSNFRDAAQPLVYFPLVGQDPTSWTISSPAYVVKTPRAETIAPEIRRLAREVAPEAPMYRVFTMAGLARDSMVGLSFTMLTLGVASMLALILGAVGLYGVLSYIVAERTREIGVRMALGAKAAQVRRMVVVQGARVLVFGVVLGVAAALGATRALGSLLFGVEALDASTFLAMSGAMIGVGLLASWVPAWRASNVDPIESLRGD